MTGRASTRKCRGACGCGTTRWTTPCPNFHHPGWRFWSFRFDVLAGREFRLDTFDETLNVGVVFINNQEGGGHGSKNNYCWRRVMRSPEKINEQGHCGGRSQRAYGDIFPPGGHYSKEGQRCHRGRSAKRQKNS